MRLLNTGCTRVTESLNDITEWFWCNKNLPVMLEVLHKKKRILWITHTNSLHMVKRAWRTQRRVLVTLHIHQAELFCLPGRQRLLTLAPQFLMFQVEHSKIHCVPHSEQLLQLAANNCNKNRFLHVTSLSCMKVPWSGPGHKPQTKGGLSGTKSLCLSLGWVRALRLAWAHGELLTHTS